MGAIRHILTLYTNYNFDTVHMKKNHWRQNKFDYYEDKQIFIANFVCQLIAI